MTDQEKYELFDRIIDQQGISHQLMLAMEEMLGLLQALRRWMRSPTDIGENVTEKVADVEIMLEQIKHMFANQAKVYQLEEDGLSQEWKRTCWMNPPYGREIGKWVKKAYETALGGALRCLLAPLKDGHGMVPRLLHEVKRHPVY